MCIRDRLEDLQRNIIPLMERSFSGGAGTVSQDQVRSFLRQITPVVQTTGGDGKLLLLASEMQIIYPQEEEKLLVSPIAEACVDYIQSTGETGINRDTVRLKTKEQETYLVNIYRVPSRSKQISYLITYCSTTSITNWTGAVSYTHLDVYKRQVVPQGRFSQPKQGDG